MKRGLTVPERLLARAVRDGECLRWTGAHTPKGYGQLQLDGRRQAVHRLAYKAWVRPIPDGLEIDHVRSRGCQFRDCIEPSHLEAVTHAENVLRAQPTHCRKGHPLVGNNRRPTIRRDRSKKGITCRQCHVEWTKAWRAKRKQGESGG